MPQGSPHPFARRVARIRKRPDFLAAAASGVRFVKPCMIVQIRKRNALKSEGTKPEGMEPEEISIRAGFTATKRLGNAVVRNRVKRRLRAAASSLLPTLGRPDCDYVFIGREQICKASYDDLIRDMKHALKRLAGMVESSATATTAS